MSRYWLSNPWPGNSWTSFDQLRRDMNELFERSGVRGARRGAAFPPINVYESDDDYVLTAELPGLEAKDIDVSIEGGRVTLRGERAIEHPSDSSIHRAERQAGRFRRTLELPVEVAPDKAEAIHRHGVLMLRIPKAEQEQPRKIAVQSS
jgi:HSP20 family protein